MDYESNRLVTRPDVRRRTDLVIKLTQYVLVYTGEFDKKKLDNCSNLKAVPQTEPQNWFMKKYIRCLIKIKHQAEVHHGGRGDVQ